MKREDRILKELFSPESKLSAVRFVRTWIPLNPRLPFPLPLPLGGRTGRARLEFLVRGVFLVNTGSAVGGGLLVEVDGPVKFLFKDRLRLDSLELGFEVLEANVSAAVAATTWVGQVVAVVFDFSTLSTPVAFAVAILLCLVRICVDVTVLREEARKVLLWGSGAVGKPSVVTVSVLVGASHCSIGGLVDDEI